MDVSKVQISKSHTRTQSRLIRMRDCLAPATRARRDGSLKDVGSQVSPVWLDVSVVKSGSVWLGKSVSKRSLGGANGEKCFKGIQVCTQIQSDGSWLPAISS